jgi:HK97 family phage portal protein
MAEKSGERMTSEKQYGPSGELLSGTLALGESVPPTDERLVRWFGAPSYAGKAVTDSSAMTVTVVWACVRILAESVGQLPWAIYERKDNGNAEKVRDHPLSDLLNYSPNGDMTTVEFREAKQVNLGLHGNTYSLIDTNAAGGISSLYPLPSPRVRPRRDSSTDWRIVYDVYDRGKRETYPHEKVWHLKGFSADGLIGFSPLSCMRQVVGTALATEEFQGRFFSNGALPSAVAKIAKWLKTPDERRMAEANLQRIMSGLNNMHKLHLLEGGMELEPWSMSALQDLQFVELRRFTLQEICRIYGVPPHRVADLDRATFSNIEQLSLEFVMFTLLPWLRRWEESANRWLLKPADRRRYFLRFNFEGLLRADTAARGQFLALMVDKGIYHRNEARLKNGDNAVEVDGMDDYTVMSNMISVDELQAIADAMRNKGSAPKDAVDLSHLQPLKEAA